MREIIARDKPFTKQTWDREKTKQVFRDKGESFKVELVDADSRQRADQDLPPGRLVRPLPRPAHDVVGKVGNAFKLMKVAGAYWRGDCQQPDAHPHLRHGLRQAGELDAYLKQLEEAEKRDHRKLGRELDLFHFQEEGPGVVFWHAKGWSLFQSIIAYMRRRLEGDYDEVNAPQMLDKSLWETSGHWDWYRENMFAAQSAGDEAEDKRWFAIKPMNCPGHVQIFKHGLKSYRDLPIRLAEFGVVHRYEPSGALHGLLRVRGFTQDDAHIFCTEDQLAAECLKINDLILSVYADFGFTSDILIKLATRPEKRVGTDAMWDHAEGVLRGVLDRIAAQSGGRIKTGVNPGRRHRSTGRSSNTCCATRSAATGNAAPRRWTSTCRSGSARSTSTRTAREAARDGAPRDLRLARTLHRHPDRELRRALPALARAEADRDRDHHAGRRRLRARGDGAAGAPACAPISTCATRRSTTRSASTRWRRSRALLVVGKKEAETRQVSIRRLGSEKQTVMPLGEALAALADEAVPPDVRRMRERLSLLTRSRRGSPRTASSPRAAGASASR
jgi:threonyl-tRNA synthetase